MDPPQPGQLVSYPDDALVHQCGVLLTSAAAVRDLRDLEHVIVDGQACRLRGVTGLLDPGPVGEVPGMPVRKVSCLAWSPLSPGGAVTTVRQWWTSPSVSSTAIGSQRGH